LGAVSGVSEPTVSHALKKSAGPDGAMAFGNRCIRERNYGEASRAFAEAENMYRERATDTDPFVVAAMAKRAWCLVNLGDLDQAIKIYSEAINAKERRGDSKEPTLQKLRQYLKDAQVRRASPG
jgi:hypothetical protein